MKTTIGREWWGGAGSALEVIQDTTIKDRPDWQANLGTHFIDAPGQAIAWRNYLFVCIHLRDIVGARKAHAHFLGATHEYTILALDPRCKPTAKNPNTWTFLSPTNLCVQVAMPSDTHAVSVLTLCTQAIVDGELWVEPPLSGQQEPWCSLLRIWSKA